MKSSIAIIIAALFATGTAFAQNGQPQARKAPTQIAQSSGGASSGAGGATGKAGEGMSTETMVAIGAGVAIVAAAVGSNGSTGHH